MFNFKNKHKNKVQNELKYDLPKSTTKVDIFAENDNYISVDQKMDDFNLDSERDWIKNEPENLNTIFEFDDNKNQSIIQKIKNLHSKPENVEETKIDIDKIEIIDEDSNYLFEFDKNLIREYTKILNLDEVDELYNNNNHLKIEWDSFKMIKKNFEKRRIYREDKTQIDFIEG